MSFDSWCEARQSAYQKKLEMERNGYQLIRALYDGDVEGIRYFLTTDLNLEGRYALSGCTTNTLLWHAIHAYDRAYALAVHNTRSEMECEHILYGIEQLIKKGANVNVRDEIGRYHNVSESIMITYAIAHTRSLELVTQLLQSPTIFDSDADMEYTSILMIAIQCSSNADYNKDSRAIAHLIARDPRSNVNKYDKNRTSVLQFATHKEDVELVHILLERGASIDHQDGRGSTALHVAVHDWFMEDVTMLINKGFKTDEAIVEAEETHGIRRKPSAVEMVKLLLRYGASPTHIAPHMTKHGPMDSYTYAKRFGLEKIVDVFHEHEEQCERNALGCAMNPPEAGMSNLRRSIESIDSRLGSLACVLGWF